MRENKEIRKLAKQMLLSRNNLQRLAFGVCICLMAIMLPIIAFSVISGFSVLPEISEYLSSILFSAACLTLGALLVFVTVPIISGFFESAYKIYEGKREFYFADIFAPFKSSKKYFSAIHAGVLFILRGTALFAASVIAFYALQTASGFVFAIFGLPDILNSVFEIFSTAFCVILFIVLACVTSGGFFTPYFICKGFSVNKARELSHSAVNGKKPMICRYIFGFSGIFVLSLLTVGTLFVIYTIPLMIFAYFIYADQITENTLLFYDER
ncbi:MAG: hypothetical protein IJ038_06510 [Clostridia bacterium]|nr:hypothetical protein [Clostridia bacterium]